MKPDVARYRSGGRRHATTRSARSVATVAALILGLSLMAVQAVAAPIPFRAQQMTYELNNEPLPDFLERFFADQGLQVVLSPLVSERRGGLNGPRNGTGAQIWHSIATSNQLIAYYDNYAVHVYMMRESATRYLSVPPPRVQEFARMFTDMRLGDAQNSFKVRADTGLIEVSGAPRFVDQVQQLTSTVSGQFSAGPMSFKIFPLKYAWATDTTITVSNRIITIPGVATTLRDLVYGPGNLRPSAGSEVIRRPTATRVGGQGLASQGDGLPPLTPQYPAEPSGSFSSGADVYQVQAVSGPATADGSGPRIVADPYRNAIIIRDRPDHIDVYSELIRALDVEPRLVEIEATIIDVNINRMRDLGVDWRWRNAGSEIGFAQDGVRNEFIRALAGDNIDLVGQAPGLQLGTIIGDSYRFIARVNALSQRGITNIVSRPQVVTLNDVEAVIENSRSVYVPVAGAYEVDLFNVVAGTVLRVTPHIINDEHGERIRMLVTIEDGDVTLVPSRTQRIDFPEAHRTAVNTQALVNDGQSLLLGGLIRERSGRDVRQVPGLGSVPVLGAAFRREAKVRDSTERLFLLTPRLVPVNQITGQTYSSDPAVSIEQIDQHQAEKDREERRNRFRSRGRNRQDAN